MKQDATASSGYVRTGISVALCVFVLVEVNYPLLQPQSRLALFGLLGLTLLYWRERRPEWGLSRMALP